MKVNLLIADDEEVICTGLQKMVLEFEGLVNEAFVAFNGLEALELARAARPEILLVDIDMPVMDGLTFIEKARRELPESRMIIISGYDRFEYAKRAISLGVSDYLLKPIGKPELYHAIKRAAEAYEERQQELGLMGRKESQTAEQGDLAQQALGYIGRHFTDSTLTLASLAERFHTARSHLSKVLVKATGLGFSAYLNDLRLGRAEKILSQKEHVMIYEVAGMVGYSSQHYFCRVFKERTGLSPTEYRARCLKKGWQ